MIKFMLAAILIASPVASAMSPSRRLPLIGVAHCLKHGCAYTHCKETR